jgi:site-specific recombinase XerD
MKTLDPQRCSYDDISAYLADLSDRCAPSTVETHWKDLRRLFRWMVDSGRRIDDPMASRKRPRVPQKDRRTLTPAEVELLVRTPFDAGRSGVRDKAIIFLFLDVGLRRAELASLTSDSICGHRRLHVLGKGRREREVPLGEQAWVALQDWLNIRGTGPGPLWIGRNGPLTGSGIRQIVKKHGLRAGIDVSPHELRHTFVDEWLRNGGSSIDLATIAGWTTTRMAHHYGRYLANDRAHIAHRKFGPLDRLLLPPIETLAPAPGVRIP